MLQYSKRIKKYGGAWKKERKGNDLRFLFVEIRTDMLFAMETVFRQLLRKEEDKRNG